jgi:hypothetical protein
MLYLGMRLACDRFRASRLVRSGLMAASLFAVSSVRAGPAKAQDGRPAGALASTGEGHSASIQSARAVSVDDSVVCLRCVHVESNGIRESTSRRFAETGASRGHHALLGGITGAVIGGVAGFLISQNDAGSCRTSSGERCPNFSALFAVPLFAGAGAVLGALIGLAWPTNSP